MMRKFSIVSAVALVAAAAGSASAATQNYSGSDTLKVFTQTLITACAAVNGGADYPALAEFVYLGGGSTAGANDMKDGKQDISPMSRALSAPEACEDVLESGYDGVPAVTTSATAGGRGSGAAGLVIGLDGLSVAVNPIAGARCDTDLVDTFSSPLAFSSAKQFFVTNFTNDNQPIPASLPVDPTNTARSIYTFTNFQDVLRIIYAGADKTRANNVTEGGGNSQRQTNREARCTSDVRRSLVTNWDNIIENNNPAACSGAASCGSIRRAIRRADDSGTTDTFLSLLGLASVKNSTGTTEQYPFCNGLEREDLDPIRRSPAADDDVSAPGSPGLGLVIAMEPYTIVAVSQANQQAANYPTLPCALGIFNYRNSPVLSDGSTEPTCPDGGPQVFTQCLTPQAGPANAVDAAIQANCLNDRFNTTFLAPAADGRSFNKMLRSAPGNMRNEQRQGIGFPTGIQNAYHRMRSRSSQCLFTDATQAIGCVAGASACTLGFAGREATEITASVAAPVGGIQPSVTSIQNGTYPLSRKLYFNSIIGFGGIREGGAATTEVEPGGVAVPFSTAEQQALGHCLVNVPAAQGAALNASKFVDLPLITPTNDQRQLRVGGAIGDNDHVGPGLACEDFNERNATECGGVAGSTDGTTDVNACLAVFGI